MIARKVDLIVVHCSDSDNPKHDNVATINEWHLARGFKKIGYHYFIDKSGNVFHGREESEIGAHVEGHNAHSIGICLSGKAEFTPAQFHSLEILLIDICGRYDLEKKDILGHKDLNKLKTCPNFDIHKLLSSWDWH